MDSARCHWTRKVQDFLEIHDIKQALIPSGLTSMLQPADVCWFNEIQRQFHLKWTSWYVNQGRFALDTINHACYTRIIGWLSDIWARFDETMLRKSFEKCGIVGYNRSYFTNNDEPDIIFLN